MVLFALQYLLPAVIIILTFGLRPLRLKLESIAAAIRKGEA